MTKHTFNPSQTALSAEVNENFTDTWNGQNMDDESIDLRHLTVNARGVTGSVIAFAGAAGAVPEGWFVCNGQSLSKSTYADLYAVIGDTYGNADSSHFNVPNLIGRTIAMIDSSADRINQLGKTTGEYDHTLIYEEMPVHSHGVYDPGHVHGIGNAIGWGAGPGNPGRARVDGNSPANPWGATNASGTGIGIYNAGASWAHNNMQPTMALNYIIKA